MSLRSIGRKVRMDILSQDGDVCELLFNNKRAVHASRLLLQEIKRQDGLNFWRLSWIICEKWNAEFFVDG